MQTNQEIAELFRNVAAALKIKNENRFRIIAYEKAADAIEHLTSEVKDLWDEGKLDTIPSVGTGIASVLKELFKTGRVNHFKEIFKGLSPAIFSLLAIPGLGPKRAFQLTEQLKITNPQTAVVEIEKAAATNKIAQLEGWGKKSQTDLLSAIKIFRKGQIKENRMPLPFADILAQEVVSYLKALSEVKRIDALGSLRRKVATIGDIDLSVATTDPKEVLKAFVNFPKVRKIVDQGPKGATVLLSVGRQVDLRVQEPKAYGAMLQYFTGSKHHNIKLREYALKQGLSLNEHGIKLIKKIKNSCLNLGEQSPDGQVKLNTQDFNSKSKIYEFATEKSFYEAMKMDWIPPELREDTGEIEAALKHSLPHLVETADIRGDLHIHSNYDIQSSHDVGASSLEELLDQAQQLGYEYIGISDHNPSMRNHSEREVIAIMKRRKEMFEEIYYSWTKSAQKRKSVPGRNRVQLFIMLEIDIDPKGKLALPDKAFDFIDSAVVSIHSSFKLSRMDMTKRIINAFSQPKAKILGHPTGRLLGSRESYEADWEEIFAYCSENSKALEINSWPERLDLPDRLVHEAIQQGVKLVISTDSHAAEHIAGMRYGVNVARRGWAEKKDILNCMEYNNFAKWLKTI